MSSQPTAVAQAVESQVTNVQIPLGLNPGDSFIVTPENGRVFTVIVPEGSSGGTFIQVIVPDEVESVHSQEKFVKVSKATLGAAVVGGVIGTLILGPIGGLIVGGGAAYATTRKQGKIGEGARKVGNTAYKGFTSVGKWCKTEIDSARERSNASTGTTTAPAEVKT